MILLFRNELTGQMICKELKSVTTEIRIFNSSITTRKVIEKVKEIL